MLEVFHTSISEMQTISVHFTGEHTSSKCFCFDEYPQPAYSLFIVDTIKFFRNLLVAGAINLHPRWRTRLDDLNRKWLPAGADKAISKPFIQLYKVFKLL